MLAGGALRKNGRERGDGPERFMEGGNLRDGEVLPTTGARGGSSIDMKKEPKRKDRKGTEERETVSRDGGPSPGSRSSLERERPRKTIPSLRPHVTRLTVREESGKRAREDGGRELRQKRHRRSPPEPPARIFARRRLGRPAALYLPRTFGGRSGGRSLSQPPQFFIEVPDDDPGALRRNTA